MRLLLISLLPGICLLPVACGTASSRLPSASLVAPVFRTAPGADPAEFTWSAGGRRVRAVARFEQALSPGSDVIGGYVDQFRVTVDGETVILDSEIMERFGRLKPVTLNFSPAVEMELHDFGDRGFTVSAFPQGYSAQRVVFTFDETGRLARPGP